MVCVLGDHSIMSDSLRPHGLQPTSLLCPWDFPGKNTGVGCHFLLQGIFPTQGSIVQILSGYPDKIREAGAAHSPALVANFAYDLAKEFNQYYHDTQILREADAAVRDQRLLLISVIARTLRHAMNILGIDLPERM